MPFIAQIRTWSLAIMATVALSACMELPELGGRTVSTALPPAATSHTRLGATTAPLIAAHPGLTGIAPLNDAHDAFVARVGLARAAGKTLDIQYYIWRDDMTGNLLFRELLRAAERDVHVRLLLDDNNTPGLDDDLRALATHPNIEVRVFNPFMVRSPRFIGFVTDFSRLNRRMHNKSWTADNQATIIGGRNVGDEYFGATDGVLFSDLDVLAVGPVVPAVSESFDQYWSSDSAYPIESVIPAGESGEYTKLVEKTKKIRQLPGAHEYRDALMESSQVKVIAGLELDFVWAPTVMISDDPAKGLGKADEGQLLFSELLTILTSPEQSLSLVSPYFVPTNSGTQALQRLVQRGIQVQILTNALEATDVLPVHAGYAKWRQDLLEAGVVLFETKQHGPPPEETSDRTLFGSSGSSLHAKTFAVDSQLAFVGSFNFDPRSANLNTEMGFLVESPELATQIDNAFDSTIPTNAYEVRLDEDGAMYWLERRGNELIRYDTEPGTTILQRAAVKVLSVLPIDWLL